MKRILTILFLLSCFAGYGQSRDNTGSPNHVWFEEGGTGFKKFLQLPLGPSHFTKVDSVGCIYYDTLTGNLMVNDGSAWVPIAGGDGSGTVTSIVAGRNLLGGTITTSGILTPDTSA